MTEEDAWRPETVDKNPLPILQREVRVLRRVLELGWTEGQYEWALDRWHHWDEDYLTPNGIELPLLKCPKPMGHRDGHGL